MPSHKSTDRFPKLLRRSAARRDWTSVGLIAFGWLCYLIAALMVSYSVFCVISNERIQATITNGIEEAVKEWPAEDQREQYEMAKKYNSTLGDLTAHSMGDTITADGNAEKPDDDTYNNALNVNDSGAMGVLKIPSISSQMPVYHTTTDESLANGVGHVYGTYLPISEKGLTALAAHSGGVNGLFFTRLSQLKKGDFFYFTTLGKEQAYQVTGLKTVLPENLGKALEEDYSPDKTKMDLITCTPIGVNTHRLIVTGELREMPGQAPYPNQVQDNTKKAIIIASIIFVILMLIAIIVTSIIKSRKKEKIKPTYVGVTTHGEFC